MEKTKSGAETHCRLVIPNQLSAVRQMSAWLDETIRRLGGPEGLVFNFDLCANEAVTNIISYAYENNGAHDIVLQLTMQNEKLILEIEDDGVPFNPLDKPEHVSPASLDDAEIGGLGIDLIRKFMDECIYSRQRGKNILRMVAYIGS